MESKNEKIDNQKSLSRKPKKDSIFYALSLGSELGFLIALPLIIFLLAGWWLDKKIDTFPLFTILFIFLGLIAAFFDVRYLILPFLEKKVGEKDSKSEVEKK